MNVKKIFWVVTPILFLLTGCYNYRELTDLAIVSGISVSMVDGEYEVMVEVVNPKKQQDSTGSDEPDFIIYKKKDSSMQEAFRRVIEESPKKLYGSHMNILIIDESVANQNLPDILDFFARDPEVRNEFYVLIGKSNDILSVTTPLENISSKNILDSLKANNDYLGYTNLVTFHDLTHTYLNPYQELAISTVESVGNEEKGENIKNLQDTERHAASIITGISIFKDNKLVGYLQEEDALSYNLVTGNAHNFLIHTNYDKDNYVICEVFREKTDIKADSKNKKITITISGSSSLVEETVPYDLEDVKAIKRIQKDLNQKIEDMVSTSVLQTISKYHTDVYGFHNAFYLKNPSFAKKFKQSWNDEVLPLINIEVKSNIKIIEKGNLNGGLYDE